MRVIITGATGAIGVALVQKFIKERIQVLAICHKGSQRISHIPTDDNVRVLEKDLCELSNLKEEIKEVYDVFIHLAWAGTAGEARNDLLLQLENIRYTLDAVSLAKELGCHTFIGAGSQAEYGRVEGLLTEKTPTAPENGYGMAKLCAGQMSRQMCAEAGIRHIWVRILSVYGPCDGRNSMISNAIRNLSAGRRAGFTQGGQLWDYLYSEDAAEALWLLMQKGIAGKTYVLGSGKVRPLREYIEEIYEAVQEKYPDTCGQLGVGDYGYAEKQVMYLGADISELKKDTGFEPKVLFSVGIRKTVSQQCGLI